MQSHVRGLLTEFTFFAIATIFNNRVIEISDPYSSFIYTDMDTIVGTILLKKLVTEIT